MSWLVRMELDKEALRSCSFHDSYAWHQALWQCFPDRPAAERDFLSRIDWMASGCRIYLLCRTEAIRPAWCAPRCWAVKEIAPTFLEHDRYFFDIVANPTKKSVIREADGQRRRNGKRSALLSGEERRQWFLNKAAQHGFMLDESLPLEIEDAGTQLFWRKGLAGVHIGARFKGCLRVNDRQLFQNAFYHGIGSAKAFGFGMMLLKAL